ncbi:MAG: hypothetical protein WDO19_19040 [Bacteroidota bacterium]
MTTEEISHFESDEYYRDYIHIRLWDDKGKDPDQPIKEEDVLRIKGKNISLSPRTLKQRTAIIS